MGIQGMTNWKFSAFLTIALMLVAGMVSTAIAADGAGSITVEWAPDDDTDVATRTTETLTTPETATTTAVPLPSGSKGNAVQFTYTVPDATNMDGGSFKLMVPSGWMVSKKLVTIYDGGTAAADAIYETDAAAKFDTTDNGAADDNDTADTRKRVTILPSSGDNISSVEVSLDADWNAEGSTKSLTIRFDNVTAPIPSRLRFKTEGDPMRSYEEYQFTSSSKKKDGRLTRLKPPADDPDTPEDESDVNPQPYVRVGNAAAGTGTVAVTPMDAYEMEPGVDFRITYTAAGPMYNSVLRINVPDALIPNDAADGPDDGDTAGEAEDELHFFTAHTTVSQRGGVDFGQVDPDAATPDRRHVVHAVEDDSPGTITIYIDSMGKGDQIRVFYEDIKVEAVSEVITDQTYEAFTVETDTDESGFDDLDFTEGQVGDPMGKVHPLLGAGKVAISPNATEIKSVRDYTITYTAPTKLSNVYLVVSLPEAAFVDGDDVAVTLLMADRTNDEGMLNYAYIPTAKDQTISDDESFVFWKIASIGKNSTFKKTIKRLRADDEADTHSWGVRLMTTLPDVTAAAADLTDGMLPAAQRMLYILQAGSKATDPDVLFTSDIGSDGIAAASEPAMLTFTFTLLRTPIKDGHVSFRIPSGWTAPNKKADAMGQVTVQTDADTTDGDEADLDAKHVVTSSQKITVNLEGLGKGGRVIVMYKKGMVQRNAGNVKITGYFKSGKSLPERVSEVVEVMITNVGDGSGTATISPKSVEAGSDDNTLVVRFMAPGSMDGGRVRLKSATDWGDFQDTNSSGKNYIMIKASSGGSLRGDPVVDNDLATAYLDEFSYGNVLTFTVRNVVAQRNLGVANFMIQSAGSRDGNLHLVEGVKRPKDADTPMELLGQVYISATADDTDTDTDESHDGLLRVEVTGGGDGSGTVDVAIINSKAGPDEYQVTADDGTVSTQIIEQIHAGDDEAHIRFTYKPIETIGDGELRFTAPSGWSAPQANSVTTAGYTSVTSTGSIGSIIFSGMSLNVPIYSLETGQTITINYGSSGGGAVAPKVSGPSAFDIQVKGSASGSLASVSKAPTVTVRPQASGRGTAMIDTGGDVYAGDMGRTFTITYTAIGQIVGGKLKVTVPNGDDWADAMASSIDVSAGTATYGGDLSATALADNKDVATVNDVVISNIDMAVDATLTVTYMSDAQPKAGDVTFMVAFDGGHGPGTGFDKVADLSVTVMEARAGSGMVMIDQMGEIVAASTGNDLTITYTVAGQIKGTVPGQTTMDRLFRVKVPAGWSAPINDAEADDKMGTYTVTHSRMADDGTYADRTGEVEKQAPAKAAGAAAGDPAMYMVARVVAEKTVEKGDKIMFAYQNATAPTMPEKSAFKFFFDGTQVTPDLNVIVQSAEGASALGLSAENFNIEDGPATVTVKLMAADGSAATRNEATVVTLMAEGGTLTPTTVSIPAGEYMATSKLSATTAGMITINASTTATGIAAAEAIMVTADTTNTSVDSVSVAPMYAKAGDTVMVSAMGTPVQTASFSVSTLVTDMAMTEDEAGSYSGSFMVVVDQHPDGAHTVTVSLNGASGTGMLTIDNMAPEVSMVTAMPAMVANGDTVTIKAMAADNNSVASVMADVSMLDSTQTDMVELMMGEGDDSGYYMAEVMISEDNEAMNGEHTITITAMDAAGNSGMGTAMVTLQNTISYTSTLPAGISLFSVPLMEEGLSTVSDLETKLGDNVNLLITYDGTTWNSRSGDVAITGDLGILVSMAAETSVTFMGHSWGDSMINLQAGSNLVGLPVNDEKVTNISDIAGLFAAGVVTNVIASSGGEFQLVAAAGDPADGPVMGDAAYLVMASAAGSAMVSGDGWMNGGTGSAPIALAGYTVDNQTPVLDVNGSVVDEITGIAQEGFRVKVKNLSTKSALSSISSIDVADGYNMTFVDLADNYAARVGDVLEISADSPTPLIGVQPVRHIVTVDDVKNGIISLENLIAYEIPAETELLRNYPNPFNPETWIPYHLSEDADVKLTIYDVNGELVRDIDVGHQTAAKYDTRTKAIYWDGRNRFGEQVASGVYFYHLQAGDFSGTRKMVILK